MNEQQGLVCNLLWTICILPHESTSPLSTLKTYQTKTNGLAIPRLLDCMNEHIFI